VLQVPLNLCYGFARLPELTRKNIAYYYKKKQYGNVRNNKDEVQGQIHHRRISFVGFAVTVSHTMSVVKPVFKDLTVSAHNHADTLPKACGYALIFSAFNCCSTISFLA
jgi:hypothetical protein